MTMKGQFKKG